MARLPRLIVPNQPHHVIQTGANNQDVFLGAEDYQTFLGWLRTAAKTYKVAVHCYVLMPNHLHLLVTPSDETGLGQMMQWIGRYYVPYFNQKYSRSGTLWNGRYKTSLIDADAYFMLCSRYIEFNPVRNGMAARAEDYPWSSYCHHAGIRPDGLVTDHAKVWELGNTPFQREAAYIAISEPPLTAEEITLIGKSLLKGWPLGSQQFQTALQARVKRQVLPAKRGRPFKIKPAAE
ncbi:putative transposase [Duganella sp. CF402]|uniref:transposase n=1 Tax=unclassified Duganella TaxID=2636909 RepID=UPI0008C10C1B|nr:MULTISPECIES: transposase [unclassified Duganella]RZT05513.1 putative transposase [Duganella sp. BK701]SEN01312.1 putative transposase [Duganella sp. CF402]